MLSWGGARYWVGGMQCKVVFDSVAAPRQASVVGIAGECARKESWVPVLQRAGCWGRRSPKDIILMSSPRTSVTVNTPITCPILFSKINTCMDNCIILRILLSS
eukprot:6296674-Amphidinium_carterae.1